MTTFSIRLAALGQFFARQYLARFVLSVALYTLVLWLSFYLIPPGSASGASLVWPPAALGLALLFFWGLDLWPAIAVSFFIVLFFRDISPPLIAATALGNSGESLVGAYVLRYFVGFSPMMSRLRDTLGLIAAAMLGAFVAASVITLGVFVFNQRPSLNSGLWVGLWIGHLVSVLSIAPFLLRWACRPLFTKTSKEILEGVAVFGTLATICWLLFWTPYGSVAGISLVYVMIIPLIWAALRTGPRGMALALFILATIGCTGVLFGYGPISLSTNDSQTIFGVQMIIGTLSLIFLLFTSITEERKEAVEELEAHVNKLETALQKISSEDQAKSDFIAILAHELRNPLSPLLSGLELLKIEERGQPEVLRMMGAHLNTIARLLDDLLDISRISQKKFKLQKEPVEIHAVVAHCLEMVGPNFAARNHTLSTSLPQEEIWLNGDPVRLVQIFVNVLNNAAKYTDPGGIITFVITREASTLVAKVKDNGIGIPPERMGKIFEPFGGSEIGGHRPGGLRIGLSLARRMAEMHNGSIEVASGGSGKGTELTIKLPLPDTMPLPLQAERSRSRGRFSKDMLQNLSAAGMKILVVDDNEAAAKGLQKLLEHYGHEVTVAYDAPEALANTLNFSPHVALLDIGLPTMDGYRLAELMRGRFGTNIKLVALTGYGQSEDKQKARDAGFDEHLVKPVSISDIQRVLLELGGTSRS